MRVVGLTGGIACGKSTVSAVLRAEGLPVVDADEIAKGVSSQVRRARHMCMTDASDGAQRPLAAGPGRRRWADGPGQLGALPPATPLHSLAGPGLLMLIEHGRHPRLDPSPPLPLAGWQGRWGYRRVVAAFGPAILLPDGELDRLALAELVFSDPGTRRRLNAATHPAVGLELARRLLLSWLRCEPVVVVDMPLLFESGAYLITRPRVLVACSPATQVLRLMARDGLDEAAARARVAAQMPLEQKRRLADVVVENEGGLQELQHRAQALAQQLRRGTWVHRLVLSPLGLAAAAALLGASCWLAR